MVLVQVYPAAVGIYVHARIQLKEYFFRGFQYLAVESALLSYLHPLLEFNAHLRMGLGRVATERSKARQADAAYFAYDGLLAAILFL